MRISVAQAIVNVTIDIDELLRPISDDRRGGDIHAYSRELRQKLSELRNPPRSANPDDPDQMGSSEEVDWNAIIRIASDALRNTTKDLRIACHLAEAAMNCFGIAGLRDGLTLVRRMADEFWNDLAPALDPDDPETRCSPLENLLNDPVHGPRLPTAIRSLPILAAGEYHLSLVSAMRQSVDMTTAAISCAIRQISIEQAVILSDELNETIAELDKLQHVMIERLADNAPCFPHLNESLALLRQWFDSALKQQLQSIACADRSSGETHPEQLASTRPNGVCLQADTEDSVTLLDQSLQLRSDAYRQLTNAANVLQRMEPHSPIPYMVHRAVQLGQMPFPKLMSQLVKEESTLAMFSRELGLPSIEANASQGNHESF